MAVRFDDIGNRLKAFRLASGLSADEIARRLGISRAALYRFERGELAKIETLEKLAELLRVSVPTLFGVGVEYIRPRSRISSACARWKRRRAHHRAGRADLLPARVARFHQRLAEVLTASIPYTAERSKRPQAYAGADHGNAAQRKDTYRQRRPGIVNLLAASEVGRFLHNGLIGRHDLPDASAASAARTRARRPSICRADGGATDRRPNRPRSGHPAPHGIPDLPPARPPIASGRRSASASTPTCTSASP